MQLSLAADDQISGMEPLLDWRNRWDGHSRPDYAPFPPPPHPTYDLDTVVKAALEEDSAGIGDVTTLATIPDSTQAIASFLAKADGVLAGLAVADKWKQRDRDRAYRTDGVLFWEVFELVDPELFVQWKQRDGDIVSKGAFFGEVSGSARSILTAERIALNFMQRMSGIATATRQMVEAVQGTGTKILETRKTVPCLRLLDKWAVLIGGGANHRIGLFDMVMIKNNHIAAAGSIEKAVQCTMEYTKQHGLDVPVEVETRTLQEVLEVKELIQNNRSLRIDRVMLDNMTTLDKSKEGGVDVSMLQNAMDILKGVSVETEASGNVMLQTAPKIASTGVNFISCGYLTHSVTALDISLRIHEK